MVRHSLFVRKSTALLLVAFFLPPAFLFASSEAAAFVGEDPESSEGGFEFREEFEQGWDRWDIDGTYEGRDCRADGDFCSSGNHDPYGPPGTYTDHTYTRLQGRMLLKEGETGRSDLSVKVWMRPTGFGSRAELLFYWHDATSDGYVVILDQNAMTSGFYRIRAGVTDLAPTYQCVGVQLIAGIWNEVELIVQNHNWYLFMADTLSCMYGGDPVDSAIGITGLYSYNPSYSSFPADNRVGLGSLNGVMDFDTFRIVRDTVYEGFDPAKPNFLAAWKSVPGAPAYNNIGGSAEIHNAAGPVGIPSAIYFGGPTVNSLYENRGFDGFVMDFDYKFNQGPAPACLCDWLYIYFRAGFVDGNQFFSGLQLEPDWGYELKLPFSQNLNSLPQLRQYNQMGTLHTWTGIMPTATDALSWPAAGSSYHIRIVSVAAETRVYVEDLMILSASNEIPPDFADDQYRYSGWQINGKGMTWGSVLVDNIVVGIVTQGDSMYVGNTISPIWQEYGTGVEIPSRRQWAHYFEVGPDCAQGNACQSGDYGIFMKPTPHNIGNFVLEMDIAVRVAQGGGAWVVLHKSKMGTTWQGVDCVQLQVASLAQPMMFQRCPQFMGPGTPFGTNGEYWSAVTTTYSHLRVVVNEGHYEAWMDGVRVAEADLPGVAVGGIPGFYTTDKTTVDISEFWVELDSDADALPDMFERGGLTVQTGVLTVGMGAGPADYEFPVQEAGFCYQILLRALIGKSTVMQATVEQMQGGGMGGATALSGSGRWQIYTLGVTFMIPAVQEMTFRLNFAGFGAGFSLDWLALKRTAPIVQNQCGDFTHNLDHSTHVQDATDYVNGGVGLTSYTKALTYFGEWEFADFDTDQIPDSTDYQATFRTDVPMGAVSGKYYDKAVYANVATSSIRYNSVNYFFDDSYVANGLEPIGDTLFTLADGSRVTVDTIDRNADPPKLVIRVWIGPMVGFGVTVSKWSGPFSPHPGGPGPSVLMPPGIDAEIPTFGVQEVAMGNQMQVSNLRYALFIGVSDDNAMDNGQWKGLYNVNFKAVRDALLRQRYVDNGDFDFDPSSCMGNNGVRPIVDHILVANSNGQTIDPCIGDFVPSAPIFDNVFFFLSEVLTRMDQLLIYIPRTGNWYPDCRENEGDWPLGWFDMDNGGDAEVLILPFDHTEGETGDCTAPSSGVRVDDFLTGGLNGYFLARVTQYSQLTVIVAVPSAEDWSDVLNKPRTQFFATSAHDDAPDMLDDKNTNGGAISENWAPTSIPKFEHVPYLAGALGGLTPGANDVQGSNRRVHFAPHRGYAGLFTYLGAHVSFEGDIDESPDMMMLDDDHSPGYRGLVTPSVHVWANQGPTRSEFPSWNIQIPTGWRIGFSDGWNAANWYW